MLVRGATGLSYEIIDFEFTISNFFIILKDLILSECTTEQKTSSQIQNCTFFFFTTTSRCARVVVLVGGGGGGREIFYFFPSTAINSLFNLHPLYHYYYSIRISFWSRAGWWWWWWPRDIFLVRR